MSRIKYDLKPCPFCGGAVSIEIIDDEFSMVCCQQCASSTSFGVEFEDGTACNATPLETVKKWNSRTKGMTKQQIEKATNVCQEMEMLVASTKEDIKDAKLIAERLYNATSYMDADDYEEKCEENVEQMVKELNLLPENSVLISRLQLLINREDSTNRLDSKITTSSLLFSKKVINAIAEYEEKNKIHERVTCWFGDYAMWAYNAYNEYKIINRLKEMINSEFKGDDEIEKQIRFIDWLLGDEAQNINTVYAVASSLEFDELVWLTQEPEKYFEKRIKVQE